MLHNSNVLLLDLAVLKFNTLTLDWTFYKCLSKLFAPFFIISDNLLFLLQQTAAGFAETFSQQLRSFYCISFLHFVKCWGQCLAVPALIQSSLTNMDLGTSECWDKVGTYINTAALLLIVSWNSNWKKQPL